MKQAGICSRGEGDFSIAGLIPKLQHKLFGHTFSGIHLAYATEIKSIQLHDSIVMALP